MDGPFPQGGSADARWCARFRRRRRARECRGVERVGEESVAPGLERGGEGASGARESAAREARRRSGPALRHLALVVVDSESPPTFAALEVDSAAGPGAMGSVVIEAREVTVRLAGDMDASRIAEIASALRGH